MTEPTLTKADVQTLADAQKEAIKQAQRELGMVWRETENLASAARRDALVDLTQAIVHRYGNLGSSAAEEWYNTVRLRWFDDLFEVNPFEQDPNDDYQLRRIIRAKADMLFPEAERYDPEGFLKYLNNVVERNVHQHGRTTIARAVEKEPHRGVRFGRVPTGATTCIFCFMLASRGFVYRSADTASFKAHFKDDCEIVPEFKAGANQIEGYDPDSMADMWAEARASLDSDDVDTSRAKSKTTNQVMSVLRQQHPELFEGSDGRVH